MRKGGTWLERKTGLAQATISIGVDVIGDKLNLDMCFATLLCWLEN